MAKDLRTDKINIGEDDEMLISGYRRSYLKTSLTALLVLVSCGLVLVLLSWKRSINMLLTHVQCSLEEAKKVLLVDSYNQQYVEPVIRPPEQSYLSKPYTYFYNKKIKYVWDPQHSKFTKVDGLSVGNCAHFHSMVRGLSTTEAVFRLQFYGTNSIFVEVKPILKLILQEIRSPFYIYQMFIVIVWLIQVYYQFAVCIVLLSSVSIAATVWETRKQSRALRDAVRTDAVVTVLRDGKEVQKPSDELVPGDVLIIPQGQFVMVCDAVLLNGNCVVNESMLTGESTPITKVPISSDTNAAFSTSDHKRSILFCGTQILHSRGTYDDATVKAIVFRTGFTTSKGELVRAILYPKPVNFKLYTDLFKCMVMFFFIGIPPMVYTALIWIRLQAHVKDIIIIVADVVTFLVPPVLPAVLTSVNAHAQRRLRKHGIFCLNSRYINFCGGLDVVCFDKTGTLTEDSLDFSGTIPAENGRFTPAVKEVEQLPNSPLVKAMAACHSLSKVGGNLLGHTLDVKLFEAVGWDLEEPSMIEEHRFEKVPPRIVLPKKHLQHNESAVAVGITRQFPFESLLRRMSVVTKTEGSDHFEVYLKGAPELVASLSLLDTVPENFKEVLELYTRQGFRVLAVGWKPLPPGISWDQMARMKREELECDLHFQGLIVMQNRLKPETVPALSILKAAAIRSIMVTGDNLLTAITVARDCGMIEEYDSVITVEAEMVASASGQQRLRVHYNYAKFPGISEKVNMIQNGSVDDMYLPVTCEGRYHIAMEGKSFNIIRLNDSQLLDRVVLKGTIFARMLPEQKLHLIETLQNLGYQVGMCGDGANDCGALKTAHAGVSLSVAEASVASPFTATQQNIECIPTVIREGRATLAATFGVYRYMVCYCFVLLASVLMLFWDGQKPSDGGYVMIDIVLNLLPPIVFGSTEAYPRLVKRPPTRSIISILPLFSIFTFIAMQIGVYVLAREYCIAQPWYEPFIYDRNRTHSPAASHLGTTILSVNMMSYVIAAVVFAPGPPYRKNLTSNKIYMAVVIAEFLLVSLLILYPPDFISGYINFKRAPFIEFHMVLYVLSIANFIIIYLWEVFFVQGILFNHFIPKIRKLRGPIHKFEKLEAEISYKNEWPPIGNIGRDKSCEDEESEAVRPSSVSRRNQWSRRSSDIRRSLLVGLKLSSDRKDSRIEPLSFVTFHNGRHQLESQGGAASHACV